MVQMMDIKKLDVDKLTSPHPMAKIFKHEEGDALEFYKKVAKFKSMMLKEYLWLSDEFRTDQAADLILANYFSGYVFNVFYEIGDFQALIGFTNILPEFKCSMTFKLMDKSIWGADFVRMAKELSELYIREFALKRISSETPDKKIVRMAEMIGFRLEGEQPDSFRWNKKFYPLYLMGKYGDNNVL